MPNHISTWVATRGIKELDDDAKEAILKSLIVLKEIGPALGRPYVDSVNPNS